MTVLVSVFCKALPSQISNFNIHIAFVHKNDILTQVKNVNFYVFIIYHSKTFHPEKRHKCTKMQSKVAFIWLMIQEENKIAAFII